MEASKERQFLIVSSDSVKAISSTYEEMINELELENKNLISELAHTKNDPSLSASDGLLEESLQALNLMRAKVCPLLSSFCLSLLSPSLCLCLRFEKRKTSMKL
jgi:hypothetical protein